MRRLATRDFHCVTLQQLLNEMADIVKLRGVACKTIDDSSAELNNIGQEIWRHPQQNFEEVFAHNLLTTFLKEKGFEVTPKVAGLETAFRAVYNGEMRSPRVGIICEYDALPGIDHACGHNLIAEAGIAAALGGRKMSKKKLVILRQLSLNFYTIKAIKA